MKIEPSKPCIRDLCMLIMEKDKNGRGGTARGICNRTLHGCGL